MRSKRQFKRALWNCAIRLLILPLLAFCGCIVGPDYESIEHPLPEWSQDVLSRNHAGDISDWWNYFHDPILNDLIATADFRNRDLNAAIHRIDAARARAAVTRASAFPQIFGFSSGLVNRQSSDAAGPLANSAGLSYETWRVGLDGGWELDLFGRIQRQHESALAKADAEFENYRDLLRVMHADVAEHYLTVRALQEKLAVLHRNLELQTLSLEIARKRHRAGVTPKLDIHQAELSLSNLKADIPPLQKLIQQNLFAIDLLIGTYSGACEETVLAGSSVLPVFHSDAPLNIDPNAIRDRPDVRAAERRVAAQTAQLGVTISELYPRLTLGQTISFDASSFVNLFDASSFAYSLGPSVRWSLFRSNAVQSEIAAESSQLNAAIAELDQATFYAYSQVENGFAAYNAAILRKLQLERAVEAARLAAIDVQKLYKTGKTDFENVLETQDKLFQVETKLIATRAEVLLQVVAIYRAFGGGAVIASNESSFR